MDDFGGFKNYSSLLSLFLLVDNQAVVPGNCKSKSSLSAFFFITSARYCALSLPTAGIGSIASLCMPFNGSNRHIIGAITAVAMANFVCPAPPNIAVRVNNAGPVHQILAVGLCHACAVLYLA